MQFHRATRQGVKPLIALFAESGCGKTMSALLLARGIVGPNGRIGMIDTESGRGSLYADVIPGGYDVAELTPPFSPARYIEAIEKLESEKFDIGIIDSGSHEWEGIGGVLDMATANEERTGKPGLHCWKEPKMQHAKMVLKMLQSPLPLIICLRAKYKSRQIKNERGKTEIVKDDRTSPIQAEDFIFEMMAHAEIMPDHTIILTKCSHPALRDCFPKDRAAMLSVSHGEAIAAWAAGGAAPKPQTQAQPKSVKAQLWKIAGPKFNNSVPEFEEWLREADLISGDERLSDLSEDRLTAIIPHVEKLEFAF